ncbi:MAG TPA: DEAD/DEAH box helicase [Steroidobacteraceae bacterium]|jgi:ATP-dependent Lhr-like helicase|nr:DEAD/DEAH box helicase [Steroidobacteraceae bacterium]
MPASFHPAVAAWFARTFAAPTEVQRAAWPAIAARQHVLIAAPTGSGKTLAAFLAAIDELVRSAQEGEGLPDETRVLYVSPLKALSNDIHRNLEAPLAGIRAELAQLGLPATDIRAFVRTGDTPQHQRTLSARRPPHIVVTTPESLYILMGSQSGRRMLATTRTVIVDEIHAMVAAKRGAHLALTLERLEAHTGRKLTRVGLSATQKPIEEVARFLVGTRNLRADGSAACTIIDAGHVRERDLQLEIPAAPLEAVMSGEVWTQVYDRLAELVDEHRTTLVFVNTRRQAERVARHLSERLGAQYVTAHHGSMAKESRLAAEARLKRGELRALVATASLELGIDIGEVDLVCQLASPRSIAAFLQRVGRSGHSIGGTPKGRLFPLSRDDLVECTALLLAVRRGELDRLRMPAKPLDVLAQQIVAEAAAREWDADGLYTLLRGAYPYRELTRAEFDEIVQMLAEGYSTRRGRHGALLHHDGVNGTVKGRRGARLTAITSGGTIPDTADYQVILEPQAQFVGTVNEDFAVESLQGDIFQLGNVSYRILRVEQGRLRVEDAHGEPPSIPFWLGEAPGRTPELSLEVSRLRAELEARLDAGVEAATAWLTQSGIAAPAALQLVAYLAAARAALGVLPTQRTLIFERFFDEAGGMQLVIHSPFGSRINRAWGLSLRKRFCRSFNFELQAAATEDTIVLSLTTAHSFELADVARYLHANSVRPLLVQALCAAPMFPVRWRWSAAIALALPRFRGGKKVPAPLARMAAEDLLAAVFPDQVACAENVSGEIEIPDHPLVRQAIRDCLEDAMDVHGLEQLLRGLESGSIQVVARDVTEPSPLALEVLSARPYAYLDDAPLEERRTQAVMSRRWLDPQSAADIGKLDAEAIARVREEAWPDATNADELHDALLWLTCCTTDEAGRSHWTEWLTQLAAARRVTQLELPVPLWVTAERLPLFTALFPGVRGLPPVVAPPGHQQTLGADAALVEVLRGRLEGSGPVTTAALAAALGLPPARIEAALAALQAEGFAMRGAFTAQAVQANEWCERRLLARIHRYTVKRLRAEVEPIAARDFLRFLFEWQRVTATGRMEGPDAVAAILAQLEGFEAAASAWETEILPSRISEYEPAWLDEQCLAGRFVWTRLGLRRERPERGAAPVRATPIVLVARRNLRLWSSLIGAPEPLHLSVVAQRVAAHLVAHGASFFDEMVGGTGLLPSQTEDALAELVALGWVNSDSFAGLRALLVPPDRRKPALGGRRRRRLALFGMDAAGRWSRIARTAAHAAASAGTARTADAEAIEHVVRTLLRRWGVLFWRLLAREADWLPPWRDLLMCCRRLEARGEIRGGRFVEGFSGEQYAAPEAITLLREARRKPQERHYVSLSGADPLNLVGILTPGQRLPSLVGNRLLYRDGLPTALLAAGEVTYLLDLPPDEQWEARNLLLRRHVPALLADLA